MYKVILSCNPTERGCIVVAWFLPSLDWEMGFCHIGDTRWTGLKRWDDFGWGLLDFTCHNNMVYTINGRKEVSVYDLQDLSVRKFSSKINFVCTCDRVKLVEGSAVSGEPLVVRFTQCVKGNPRKVAVYKWFDDRQQWHKVRNIGKRVIFLDKLHAVSLHSINLLSKEDLERRQQNNEEERLENEIYYDVRHSATDGSVRVAINRVNLERGIDVPRNPSPMEVFSSFYGSPIWFTPSLI